MKGEWVLCVKGEMGAVCKRVKSGWVLCVKGV